MYAENDETLEYATKAVYIKYGELVSIFVLEQYYNSFIFISFTLKHSDHRSVAATTIALCYIHPEGVDTLGLQLQFQMVFERGRPYYLLHKAGISSVRTVMIIMCRVVGSKLSVIRLYSQYLL